MPDDDGGCRVVPVLRPEMVDDGWDDADGYVANEMPTRRVPLALENNSTRTQVLDQISTRLA